MDSGTSWSKGCDKKTRDENNRSRRVTKTDTDSFRSESYSHRLWNLENWSDHLKEIAFDWWNSTDTRTISSVWRSFRLRYQKLIRIHDLISDCQMLRISEYPSLKIRPYLTSWRLFSLSLFGVFLSDDIETLQNPRNCDGVKDK